MDEALTPAVVDVPVGSLNQLPPDHAGPTGRMTDVFDGLIRHYTDPAGGPKRVLIEPREGFSSLSNVLRHSDTGVIESGTWTNPELLATLGNQLLSICSNRPRVYTGTDWTNYGDVRVVTQKLSQSVLHASNNTITAPDHAYIAGVTCTVWTEQSYDSAAVLNTALWIGFRADDGAWVRVPTLVYTASGSADTYMLGKVVQDGEHFWVFYNAESSGHKIFVEVYDIFGALTATGSLLRNWTTSPGYWDAYGSAAAGILLAQPAAYTATAADVHVSVTGLSLSSGTILTNTATLTDVHCTGPVAWLTNDLTGTPQYLATIGDGEGDGGKLWAYEIAAGTVALEYDIDEFPTLLPDNITGWVEDVGINPDPPPTRFRNVYVSYSQLAGPEASTGPTFDPATRFIKTVKCTYQSTTTDVRTTHSVIQQSRAFAIDSEYYAYTYYQSGSGQALPSSAQSVSWTDGDYLVGAPSQAIRVQAGDGTSGAPFTIASSNILATTAAGPFNIDGGGTADRVEEITASGLENIADGTLILKWTFKNGVFPLTNAGAIMSLSAGASIGASTTWDLLSNSATNTVLYTPTVNRQSGTIAPGNFTTSGTVSITATVLYRLPGLWENIDASAPALFDNGSITISGATGGNNGTFTILPGRCVLSIANLPFGSNLPAIWTLKTTQSSFNASTPFSATVSTANPNRWGFSADTFSAIDVGGFLNVSGDRVLVNTVDGTPLIGTNQDINNGDFQVSSASGGAAITDAGDLSSNVVAQQFTSPYPTVVFQAPSTIASYTLFLQSVDFDYRYINGLVSIANADNDTTNGVYTITDIVGPHTVIVFPTNGRTDQRSESFYNTVVIAIQLGTNVNAQTQPSWFITPLTGSQPQVGCFEKGLAYADWRFDGEETAAPDLDAQDRYRFALSSTSNPFGTIRQIVLPFRAQNFTQVSIATVGPTPIDIANVAAASTIGLKVFQSTDNGIGLGESGTLLLPGPIATEFTSSGFAESNFAVGPETPFIVSQGEDSGTNFALSPNKTYTYQIVVAETLENGNVVRSIPSPAIQVPLTGDNNYAVIGGRLLAPLDTNGLPPSTVYGVTNHRHVTYEIYRSVVVDGIPSAQLHLITSPGNPNGLYSGSGTGSGFTFPDTFTWNYRDENPDAGIRATEVIYAGSLGQGIAPHFPAPPFSNSTIWNNRRWVTGYDGAVWMSAELAEGEAPWFFPGFRYPFPEEDPAVAVCGFENYLFIFCRKSVWRVGLAEFPNDTLTSGAMPTPVKVPLAAGCSGFAVAMPDFVAYSSSVNDGRQIWAITRNLANVYLSESIADVITQPITGLAVDGQQRLLVASDDMKLKVFDPISKEWYVWRLPTDIERLTSYLGQPTYQDTAYVLQQSASAFVDTRASSTTTIAIDATFSSLSFTGVRAVKRLWEVQILGKKNGACNINAVISYPDDAPSDPSTFGPQALTATPFLIAINPMIEEATNYTIRVFGSYEDILSPGKCFALEMLSCEVGLDSGMGLSKLPNSFRLVAT